MNKYPEKCRILGCSNQLHIKSRMLCYHHYRIEMGFKSIGSMRKKRFGGMHDIVLKRDGFRCVNCGMSREVHFLTFKKDLTIDHIDMHGRNSNEKNNDLDNLQTLCLPCHGSKDSLIGWANRKRGETK